MATGSRTEPADFRGKRVTVMGLGLLGGGLGVARFLAEQGAIVTATDLRSDDELRPSREKLSDLAIDYHLGGHREKDFTSADLVVVNPGVKEDSPYLALARQHKVPLETEINLFFKLCPCRIVGITGSVGKTTTTSMVGHVLKLSGCRSWVGGNIGHSLLLDLEAMEAGDLVVVELSSFQLRRLGWARLAPAVSVVTNFVPNHLDNHPTMADYAACKKLILTNQRPGDVAILNADDPVVRAWGSETAAERRAFSVRRPVDEGAFLAGNDLVLSLGGRRELLCSTDNLKLPGIHNVSNALACAVACATAGVGAASIGRALRSFQPVEHRLEFVGEWGGVRFYNDSKATTPESTVAALESFDRPIILIAGGSSKHLAYDEFARAAVQRTKAIFLIGETAAQMSSALEAARPNGTPSVEILPSLEAAVKAAVAAAVPGNVVLLSPTTASFDMFANFEQRGERFKECVRTAVAP